jgi:hypothetical protein
VRCTGLSLVTLITNRFTKLCPNLYPIVTRSDLRSVTLRLELGELARAIWLVDLVVSSS